jgi:hypothetical protein
MLSSRGRRTIRHRSIWVKVEESAEPDAGNAAAGICRLWSSRSPGSRVPAASAAAGDGTGHPRCH